MIACGNVILCYKITGASRGPPPTLVYVNGTINYNLNRRCCVGLQFPCVFGCNGVE